MSRSGWVGVRRARTLLALAGVMVVGQGCSWFTAFVMQPKIDPWEVVTFPGKVLLPSRGNPQNSVPITGTFVSGLQVSYAPLPGVVDSMSAIQNPTAPSPVSLPRRGGVGRWRGDKIRRDRNQSDHGSREESE